MALRQPQALFIAHQIAVIELRNGKSQGAVQQNLTRRRPQQISPAHDFCDLHGQIIHHHRQLISRNVIPSPYQKIAEIPACNHPLRPKLQIVEADLLAIRYSKPPIHSLWPIACRDGRVRPPREAKPSVLTICVVTRQVGPNVFWLLRTARSRIQGLIIALIGRTRRLRDILARAAAWINAPLLPQLFPRP